MRRKCRGPQFGDDRGPQIFLFRFVKSKAAQPRFSPVSRRFGVRVGVRVAGLGL